MLRAPFAHPLGIGILGANLLLAAFLAVRQPAASPIAWALIAWGLALYFGVSLVALRFRLIATPPELAKVATVREAIASEIARQQGPAMSGLAVDLVPLLQQGLTHIDEEVIPSLRQLIDRKEGFREHIALYEGGRLPSPDPVVLDRLRAAQTRQQAAIDRAVQRAVNAEAILVELLEEASSPDLAGKIQDWLNSVVALQGIITDALRGEYNPQPPSRTPEPQGNRSRGDSGEALSTEDEVFHQATGEFRRAVEEALRRVNKPAALARCQLIDRLPLTIESVRARWDGGTMGDATPLDRAHALREILVTAIERLKPVATTDGAAAVQDLQHQIVSEEYLLGMATRHILVRHSISESTLHRNRSDAVRVIAEELRLHEEVLARGAGRN